MRLTKHEALEARGDLNEWRLPRSPRNRVSLATTFLFSSHTEPETRNLTASTTAPFDRACAELAEMEESEALRVTESW